MLDGILGYAAAVLQGKSKVPSEAWDPDDVELPLEREERNGFWWWRASAMFVPEGSRVGTTTVVRRWDWAEFAVRAGLARSPERPDAPGLDAVEGARRGWAKACLEPYVTLAAPYVDFYFDGDAVRVAELLNVIRAFGHVGGKRHAGWGRIRGIEVFRKSEGRSVWREDGQPSRPVPVEAAGEVPGGVKEWSGYRPPYWHRSRQALCWVPPSSQWWPDADGFVSAAEEAAAAVLAALPVPAERRGRGGGRRGGRR
jgi:CRISPR type IV-associated protein Csf3